MIFKLKTEVIKLDQLLKATGLCASGGEAHMVIEEGQVKVNGEVLTVKRKQLVKGDFVEFNGERVDLA